MKQGVVIRFIRYLVERFALVTILPALIIHYLFINYYISGTIDISDSKKWLVGFSTFFGFFVCLRLFDELKDKSHDDTYYKQRPVQRGLITLL